MAQFSDWVEGARMRTLPASLAPVIMGSAMADLEGSFRPLFAIFAGIVALSFQIGVNYANDYSDGVRGTDEGRQGPPRLTGGKLTDPRNVKIAAFAFFALGCAFGLALVALSHTWWLLLLGATCVPAAWFYTGGPKPYGYAGLGEIFVFLYFGLFATCATLYTQTLHVTRTGWLAGIAIGLLACAILMANNLRDIPTDSRSGKNTLSVRLGDRRSRLAYCIMVLLPVLIYGILVIPVGLWATTGVVVIYFGLYLCSIILGLGAGAPPVGRALIPVLSKTGIFELSYSLLFAVSVLGNALMP